MNHLAKLRSTVKQQGRSEGGTIKILEGRANLATCWLHISHLVLSNGVSPINPERMSDLP